MIINDSTQPLLLKNRRKVTRELKSEVRRTKSESMTKARLGTSEFVIPSDFIRPSFTQYGEEVAQLFINFFRRGDGLGDLRADQFTIALAQPMNRYL